jgi:hypothetical protein
MRKFVGAVASQGRMLTSARGTAASSRSLTA